MNGRKPTSQSKTLRELALMAAASAWLLLAIGMIASLIDVAGSYTGVLLIAISCSGVSALLLVFAVWFGGTATRILAFAGVVPFIYIVIDFFRRI